MPVDVLNGRAKAGDCLPLFLISVAPMARARIINVDMAMMVIITAESTITIYYVNRKSVEVPHT